MTSINNTVTNVSWIQKIKNPTQWLADKAYNLKEDGYLHKFIDYSVTDKMRPTKLSNGKKILLPIYKANGNPFKSIDSVKSWLPALIGIYIGGLYVLNTLNNDEIPIERKIPLTINNIVVTLFGFFAGLSFDSYMDNYVSGIEKAFEKAFIKNGKSLENMASISKGLKSFKSILIFTLMYRYFSPVIATPVTEKINNFLIKRGWLQDPNPKKKGSMDISSEKATAMSTDNKFKEFLYETQVYPKKSFIS